MPSAAAGPPDVRAERGRPLLVGVTVALLFAGALVGIADNVVRKGPLARLDTSIDEALATHAEVTPGGQSFFKAVSALGYSQTMGFLAGLAALLLIPAGQRLLVLVLLLGLFLNGPIDSWLKNHFQLERPPPPAHLHVSQPAWGFPSGHALGSSVGYGLLAYVLTVFGCRRLWTRAAVVAGLSALVLLIGFSRLYLHAHYLSQVLGGFAAGAAWLALCIVVLELLRRRPGAGRPPPGSAGWFIDAFALGASACLVAWLAIGMVLPWLGRPPPLGWWTNALACAAGGVLGLIASVIYARRRR